MVYILPNFENSENQVQGGNKSNVKVSRSVKGCKYLLLNTILICLVNAGCLAEPENPETSLVDPESPKFQRRF